MTTRASGCAALVAMVLLCSGPAGPVRAQNVMRAGCREAAVAAATREFCELATYGVETLQARVGIVALAGNPVPGTASTFGLRLGPIPRMSLDGRITVSGVELPPLGERGSSETPDGRLTSLNGDLSIGILPGLSLGATVRGLLALDLIGSAGFVMLPDDEGYDDDAAATWAAGARIGITQESFTAPGISLSALYRNLSESTFGDARLQTADAYIHIDDFTAWSFRGAISKSFTILRLTGGGGYDIFSADALVRVGEGADFIDAREENLTTGRWTAFTNVSLAFLILSLNGELGWQAGGDTPDLQLPGADVPGNGTVYFGFAVRIAI
jgi:hypothetical protein